MEQEHQQLKQAAPDNIGADASHVHHDDGTWLLITSTMGLTLGYVRIDDHDHELTLAEIREMINDKLSSNHEFSGGWNFGTGWPLKIVSGGDESAIFARNILPSVTVLSSVSAQHIINTSNPISTATALQYGLSPMGMNVSYMQMGFPQTAASSAGLQPLPMSAMFTPLHQMMHNQLSAASAANNGHENGKVMEGDAQDSNRYSANTVALLQPQIQQRMESVPHESIKNIKLDGDYNTGDAIPNAPTVDANVNSAQIPSLPPFSPPMLTQQEMEEKAKIQKAKLLNLLPMNSAQPQSRNSNQNSSNSNDSTGNTATGSNKSSPQNSENTKTKTSAKAKPKPKLLPLLRLKPMDADGNVIEDQVQSEKQEKKSPKQQASKKSAPVNVTFEQQQQLYCPECNKKFDKERGYRLHMSKAHKVKLTRGRNKDRRFQCEFDGCGKCFYQRSDLRRHQRVHLGVKPFKCSLCHKEFTQRGSLYRHVKINHKGEDPKQLTVLQTAETLPTHQRKQSKSQSQEKQDANDNNNNNDDVDNEDTQNMNMAEIPPLVYINSDNLPPALNIEKPLPPLEHANDTDNYNNNDNDDVEIKMEEQSDAQPETMTQ